MFNETINISKGLPYIVESFGKTEINVTGIIRDVCIFKYDYAYINSTKFFMMMISISLLLLILNRILGGILCIKKRYYGIDNNGFYIDFKEINKKYEYTKISKVLIFFWGNDKQYLSDDIKRTMLLIFIFRTIFMSCLYSGKFLFGMGCF